MKYIEKPKTEHESFRLRLNTLIVGELGTNEYSVPIQPIDSKYLSECWPVDERANIVLTMDEIAACVTAVPAAYRLPNPPTQS